MNYFYQDIFYISLGIFFIFVLLGYILYRRHLPTGGYLLSLVFLLSMAGLSDMIFRWNPNPSWVLSASSLNVFCYSFALTIILNYSIVHFFKDRIGLEPAWLFLILYLPALIVTSIYLFSPLMVSYVLSSPLGFQLAYSPGYWALIVYGAILVLPSALLNLIIAFQGKSADDANQSIFLLFVLLLVAFFYGSVLVFPFLYRTVNFASPLPTAFAILVLVYAYIRYEYFSLEKI